MSELTKEFTDQLYANYEANVKYAALENAVTHNGIHASLETRKSAVENTPVFSLDLTKDKVTNQKASGRCWMFAALNTFRHKMISSFQLEDFELSQAHTFFWDKYEKSNWFLEQVIATADQELTSRKAVSYTHLDVYKRQKYVSATLVSAKTGEILATTQRPSYNADTKQGLDLKNLKTWNTILYQDQYEPGSTRCV